MKKSLIFCICLLFVSCSASKYYQVFTISFDPPLSQNEKEVFYEDSICKISFNFWGEKGNVDFYFFNKTNEDLTVNLDETFFIINNFAIPYFNSRTFEYSASKTIGTTDIIKTIKEPQMTSSYFTPIYLSSKIQKSYYSSITYYEQNKIIVPPNSFRIISEPNFFIVPYYYSSSLLEQKPKKTRSVDFVKNNSPFLFRIRISINKHNEKIYLDNLFYISSIINIKESDFFQEYYEDDFVYTINLQYAPNKFYIEYIISENK